MGRFPMDYPADRQNTQRRSKRPIALDVAFPPVATRLPCVRWKPSTTDVCGAQAATTVFGSPRLKLATSSWIVISMALFSSDASRANASPASSALDAKIATRNVPRMRVVLQSVRVASAQPHGGVAARSSGETYVNERQ